MSKDEVLAMQTFETSFNKMLNREETEKDEQIVEQYLTSKFTEAVVKITPYLEKYRNIKNLEMEIRLGYIEDDDSFTTNIGEEFFEKIKPVLEATPIWDTKKSTMTKDLFSKGMRMSVDTEGNEVVIQKKKLCTLDFTFYGTPFDMRVSFSTETSVPIEEFDQENISYQRNKERDSFSYDCWDYDMTVVTYEDDGIEEKSYEVEIEMNRTLKGILNTMSPYYFLHSTFMKIEDLANMCESQDEENTVKLEFVNEKSY